MAGKTNRASIDFEIISNHFKSENQSPWIWLFLGDSITHGAAHTHGFRSFPEIFAEKIRWEQHLTKDLIINSGISGRSCLDLLNDDYDHLVRRHHHPSSPRISQTLRKTLKGRKSYEGYRRRKAHRCRFGSERRNKRIRRRSRHPRADRSGIIFLLKQNKWRFL